MSETCPLCKTDASVFVQLAEADIEMEPFTREPGEQAPAELRDRRHRLATAGKNRLNCRRHPHAPAVQEAPAVPTTAPTAEVKPGARPVRKLADDKPTDSKPKTATGKKSPEKEQQTDGGTEVRPTGQEDERQQAGDQQPEAGSTPTEVQEPEG